MKTLPNPIAASPRVARWPLLAWDRRLAQRAMGIALALLAASGAYARFLRPVPARTYVISRTDVVASVYGRGALESRREAEIGFDVPGRVQAMLVKEGDRVRSGQELARLDADQYGADVRAAASGLDAARAALGRLAAEERRARESLDFAGIDEARIRELVKAGAGPQADQDAAIARTKIARADLDRARAQQVEAARGIEVASRGVDQKRTALVRAMLLAPFDGVITARLREPGDTAVVGTTVLRMADPDDVYVRVWIDESAIGRVEAGQPAHVRRAGDEERDGVVERIGFEVDRQTHEVPVDVRLASPLSRPLLGQRADVRIETDRRTGPTIPLALVRRDGERVFTWVADGNRVRRRAIALGLAGADTHEVTEGLVEGDVVLGPVEPGGELPAGRRWAEAP